MQARHDLLSQNSAGLMCCGRGIKPHYCKELLVSVSHHDVVHSLYTLLYNSKMLNVQYSAGFTVTKFYIWLLISIQTIGPNRKQFQGLIINNILFI